MTTKYIQIVVNSKGAKANTDAFGKSLSTVGEEADNTTRSLNKLSGVAQAVIGAIATSQIIKYADAWTTVNNKLANSVKAHEELADVTGRVFNITQDTRSSIDATADLYAKLERSTRAYNVSAADLDRLTRTINQSFIVSGATVEEAETAIRQLGQGLASGALRGDEFNTVNENGNRIIRALADSLGVGIAKLRDMASQNKLTTDIIVKGLLKQSDTIANEYTKTVATFGQRALEATNNLTKFVGESVLVQSTVAGVGDAMVLASENIGTLTDIAAGLALVYVARLAPAVIGFTTSLYANIQAATRATIVTNAYGQVISRTTVVTNAATLATRGFGAAMAFLGGPVGVIFLAVAAMTAYVISASEAEKIQNKLADATARARDEYSGLSKEVAKTTLSTIEADLLAASQKMQGFNEQAEKARVDTLVALPGQMAEVGKRARDAAAGLSETGNQVADLAARANALKAIINAPEQGQIATPDTRSAQDVAAAQATIRAEQFTTQMMQAELNQRANDFWNYQNQISLARDDAHRKMLLQIEQEQVASKFAAEQDYISSIEAANVKTQALLANEKITSEERLLIQAELGNQIELANQERNQRIAEADWNAAQQRAESERWLQEYKLDLLSNGAQSAISIGENLMTIFSGQSRKMFEIGKAAATAGAIVNTYSSAVKAYDAMAGIPVVGPALGAAAAAAAVVAGLANVKRIQSSKFGGSAGGGASSYSGASVSAGSQGQISSPSAPAQDQPRLRTISIEGLQDGQQVTLNKDQLVELLSTDDNVRIAVSSGQQAAIRTGLI